MFSYTITQLERSFLDHVKCAACKLTESIGRGGDGGQHRGPHELGVVWSQTAERDRRHLCKSTGDVMRWDSWEHIKIRRAPKEECMDF
jgi:hypothetical protein